MKQFTWLCQDYFFWYGQFTRPFCTALFADPAIKQVCNLERRLCFELKVCHEFSYFSYDALLLATEPSLKRPEHENGVSFICWGSRYKWILKKLSTCMVMMPLAASLSQSVNLLHKHEIPCNQFDHREKRKWAPFRRTLYLNIFLTDRSLFIHLYKVQFFGCKTAQNVS